MSRPELIRLAVVGAAGKMGREVLRSLTPQSGFEVVVAVDRAHGGISCRDLAGQTAPPLQVEEKLGAALDKTPADVLIDFSHHSAAVAHATSAMKRGVNPIIGCTGLTDFDLSELRALVKEYPISAMYVPNFALGAVLMMRFAEMAAKWMPDVEIIELHHDRKADAPSGTATLTAQMIAKARIQDPTPLPDQTIRAEGVRGGRVSDIPVHSVRLPGFVAHQEVFFGSMGEVLHIRHDTTDRAAYMNGVKLAARQIKTLDGFVIGLDKILFRS